MPWNDQSGQDPESGKGPKAGPWGNGGGNGGGGPKSPWGGGPGGPNPGPGGGPRRGGGEQPDLEDMMRKLQERMRGGRRGGGGDGPGRPGFGASSMFVLGALLVAGWFASGVFVVDADEQAVVTRFGQLVAVRGPGLYVHLPAPIEAHRIEKFTAQRQQTVGFRDRQDVPQESLMVTGDQAIVELDFTVVWQLKDIEAFVFNVRSDIDETGQNDLVHASAESAMREVVGQTPLDQVISQDRLTIETRVRETMQQMLDSYGAGVAIVRVQLQSATAPQAVSEAFNDVDRARQDAITQVNEARKTANELIPKARGEAVQQLQQAEGYRERVVREARGEAERFNLIYEQYRRAPRVTRERLYLETMERVFGGADKIIIDGRTGVTPFLPLDQLRRGQTQASAPATGAAPSGAGGQR
jgi:membrane protease subunit HflK